MTLHAATGKAFLVTAVSVTALALAMTVQSFDRTSAAPLFLFHVTLLLNTFFSVQYFARITPKGDPAQWCVDTVLMLLLIALPFFLGSPVRFVALVTLLFVAATLKYVLLLGTVSDRALLRRKIRIDALGTVLCVLTLAGVLAGYPLVALWCWAAVFVAANVHVLLILPLYRSHEQRSTR
jgi:hypothetical protein